MPAPRKSDPFAGVGPHPLFPNEPLCFAVDSKSEPEPHLVSFEDLEDPYTRNGYCSCDYAFFRVGPDSRDHGARMRCSHIEKAIRYMCAHLDQWGVTYGQIQKAAQIEAPGRPGVLPEGLALLALSFSDRAHPGPPLNRDQTQGASPDDLEARERVPPPRLRRAV